MFKIKNLVCLTLGTGVGAALILNLSTLKIVTI